jgi:hypothetical protein
MSVHVITLALTSQFKITYLRCIVYYPRSKTTFIYRRPLLSLSIQYVLFRWFRAAWALRMRRTFHWVTYNQGMLGCTGSYRTSHPAAFPVIVLQIVWTNTTSLPQWYLWYHLGSLIVRRCVPEPLLLGPSESASPALRQPENDSKWYQPNS